MAILLRWLKRYDEAGGFAVILVRFRHCPQVVRRPAWPRIIAIPGALGCMILDTPQAHPVVVATPSEMARAQAVMRPRTDLPVREVGGGALAPGPPAANVVTARRGRGASPG